MTAIMIQQLPVPRHSVRYFPVLCPLFYIFEYEPADEQSEHIYHQPCSDPAAGITAAVWIWLCISWLIGVF